jgi:Domain of unknown function (DUF397)
MQFRKSSASQGADGCVYVAGDGDSVLLYDDVTGTPTGAVEIPRTSFAAFVKGVKAGEFDDLAEGGN